MGISYSIKFFDATSLLAYKQSLMLIQGTFSGHTLMIIRQFYLPVRRNRKGRAITIINIWTIYDDGPKNTLPMWLWWRAYSRQFSRVSRLQDLAYCETLNSGLEFRSLRTFFNSDQQSFGNLRKRLKLEWLNYGGAGIKCNIFRPLWTFVVLCTEIFSSCLKL